MEFSGIYKKLLESEPESESESKQVESESESESSFFCQLESESESESSFFCQLESESESESECWPGVGVGAGTDRSRPSLQATSVGCVKGIAR